MTKTMSEKISEFRGGPLKNPFQGSEKKVLFICTMGVLRSATAARIYANKFNARSCGTSDEALIPISKMLMEWADEAVFMNLKNYTMFMDDCGGRTWGKITESKIKVLDIPDDYSYMDKKLIKIIRQQYDYILSIYE